MRVPAPNPEAAHRLIDDQAVIVLPREGEVLVLNQVGSTIWQLVDGRRREEEIAEALCEVYAVTLEEALRDVRQFLAELGEKRVVVWKTTA